MNSLFSAQKMALVSVVDGQYFGDDAQCDLFRGFRSDVQADRVVQAGKPFLPKKIATPLNYFQYSVTSASRTKNPDVRRFRLQGKAESFDVPFQMVIHDDDIAAIPNL